MMKSTLISLVLLTTILGAGSAYAAGGQGLYATINFGDDVSASDPSDTDPVMIPMNPDGLQVREDLLTHAKDSDPIYFLTFDFQWGESSRALIATLGQIAQHRAQLEKQGKVIGKDIGEMIVLIDHHFANSPGYPREHESLQWLANQWPTHASGAPHIFVKAYNPNKITSALLAVQEARREEYITHRKIFVVGNSIIQGGRNTGPLYLEFNNDNKVDPKNMMFKSFIDVEIFIKDKVGLKLSPRVNGGAEMAGTSANIVKSMFNSTNDPVGGFPLTQDIAPDSNYVFKAIYVPAGTGKSAPIPFSKMDSIYALEVVNGLPVYTQRGVFMQPLKYTSHWKLMTSEWDGDASNDFSNKEGKDQFRLSLQKSLESTGAGDLIYFETPYFIPDLKTYQDLKAAVRRGAQFMLTTASFLTCDGDSKLIPVIMENEYKKLLALNPGGQDHDSTDPDNKVIIHYTNKHMEHAKVFAILHKNAGFGEMWLGSHNVHLRSGYFDKEVMLHFRWDQKQIDADGTVSNPIEYRLQAYQKYGHDYVNYFLADPADTVGRSGPLTAWHSVTDDFAHLYQKAQLEHKTIDQEVDSLYDEPQSAPKHSALKKATEPLLKDLIEKFGSMSPEERKNADDELSQKFTKPAYFHIVGRFL